MSNHTYRCNSLFFLSYNCIWLIGHGYRPKSSSKKYDCTDNHCHSFWRVFYFSNKRCGRSKNIHPIVGFSRCTLTFQIPYSNILICLYTHICKVCMYFTFLFVYAWLYAVKCERVCVCLVVLMEGRIEDRWMDG